MAIMRSLVPGLAFPIQVQGRPFLLVGLRRRTANRSPASTSTTAVVKVPWPTSGNRSFASCSKLRTSAKNAPSIVLEELNRESASSIYTGLKKGEIRLVTLHAAQHYRDPIRCSLRTVVLNRAPLYEALSYVWGKLSERDFHQHENPTSRAFRDVSRVINNANNQSKGWDIRDHGIDDHDIELAGHRYTITPNLNRALRRLRKVDIDRVLWIDALAINQSSIVERNSQVRMMLDIYTAAHQTVIWLGGFEYKDQKLEAYINELFKAIVRWEQKDMLDDFKWGGNLSSDRMRTLIHASAALVVNPYFSRGWTFQEVVASQDVMVLHDRFAMKLDSLTRFWKSLVTLVNGTLQDLIQDGADGDMAILEAITIINRLPIDALQPRKAQVKMPTFDSTRWTEEFIRDRSCENPRDIVFSALALLPPDIRRDIRVDYALPLEEVYMNITRSMMQYEGPFPLLNKVDEFGHYKASSATPTWIPDYDYRHREDLSLRFQRTVLELPKMNDDATSQEGQGIEPKAQPEMQTVPLRSEHSIVSITSKTGSTFADQGKVLQLPAILIGSCKPIFSAFALDPYKSRQFLSMHQEYWEQISDHFCDCMHDILIDGDDITPFTRAFLGPMCGGSHVADESVAAIGMVLLQPGLWKEIEDANNMLYHMQEIPQVHHRRVMFEFTPHLDQNLSAAAPLNSSSRIFGLGSDQLLDGDELYMAPGHDMPLICRPTGNGHEFIGFAWLPSITAPDPSQRREGELDLGIIGLVTLKLM